MKQSSGRDKKSDLRPSIEGEDFYFEGGYMVLTADFLKKRGYCCESGCRNCPYGFDPLGNKPTTSHGSDDT